MFVVFEPLFVGSEIVRVEVPSVFSFTFVRVPFESFAVISVGVTVKSSGGNTSLGLILVSVANVLPVLTIVCLPITGFITRFEFDKLQV